MNDYIDILQKKKKKKKCKDHGGPIADIKELNKLI